MEFAMNLRITEYIPKYRNQCIALMGDTWNFNRIFPGLKKNNLINKLFFDSTLLNMTYSRVILDENDTVHGYLFGIIHAHANRPIRTALHTIWFLTRAFYHLLMGNLGLRRQAWRIFQELYAMEESLNGDTKKSDAYVNLFFVNSALRGMGWGQMLMGSFQEEASQAGCNRIYLWTDKGCTYRFYDRNGFRRVKEVSSRLLADYGDEPNGFVYIKPLKTS